jgi:hypothetical protein
MAKGTKHCQTPAPRDTISKSGKLVDPPTKMGTMVNPLSSGMATGDNLPTSRGTVTKNLNVGTGKAKPGTMKQGNQFSFSEPFVDPIGKK